MDYAIRFIVGGLMVSLFAIVGDVLRPKSFAGLFAAAPSVALATLCLALVREGDAYVSVEGRSMILGALALAAYSFAVCQLMMRYRWPALAATTLALVLCSGRAWLATPAGRLSDDGACEMVGPKAKPNGMSICSVSCQAAWRRCLRA